MCLEPAIAKTHKYDGLTGRAVFEIRRPSAFVHSPPVGTPGKPNLSSQPRQAYALASV